MRHFGMCPTDRHAGHRRHHGGVKVVDADLPGPMHQVGPLLRSESRADLDDGTRGTHCLNEIGDLGRKGRRKIGNGNACWKSRDPLWSGKFRLRSPWAGPGRRFHGSSAERPGNQRGTSEEIESLAKIGLAIAKSAKRRMDQPRHRHHVSVGVAICYAIDVSVRPIAQSDLERRNRTGEPARGCFPGVDQSRSRRRGNWRVRSIE